MLQIFSVITVMMLASFIASVNANGYLPTTSDSQLREFSNDLDLLRKKHQIPGLAVAVLHNQELVMTKGFGFADADRMVKITPDTPFWIASITKSFVGLAFLHLEAQEKISLLEQAKNTPNFMGLCQWLANSHLPFGRDLYCDAPITIQHILNHQVQGTPGSSFFYNPVMYSRLSRYLEHKFGQGVDAVEGRHNELAQTIDRVILRPANMDQTMSSQWDKSKSLVYFNMARGFKVNDNGHLIALPSPERHIAGGAGVVSTVLDLAKYDIALDKGIIAPDNIKTKLFTPAKLNDGTVSPYAIGWFVQQYKNVKLIWHSGWDEEAGYSALYLKVPEYNLTLILLSNGEGLNWHNPLDKAEVEKSPFAQMFMQRFVFSTMELDSQ